MFEETSVPVSDNAELSGNGKTDNTLSTESDNNAEYLKKLVKSSVDIQPPSTVVLDLLKDEDEILKGMKSKTRYKHKAFC